MSDVGGIFGYKYFVVHEWMVRILKLKGLDLLVYAVIFGLCQYGENHTYNGNNTFLMAVTGSTRNGIQKSLKSLVSKEFIIRHERKFKHQLIITYTINWKIIKQLTDVKQFIDSINSISNN